MNEIITLIYLTALAQGVDPRLALSIAYTESKFKPDAIGLKDDTGLFQVRHELVNETKEELLDKKTNVTVAMRLLKKMKRQCEYKLGDKWWVAFNHGATGAKRLKSPEQTEYHKRVSSVYKCLGKYRYREMTNKAKECFK